MMDTRGSTGFVCKATLRDLFFLTDKWIRELGEPDKTAPNPHYKSAAPMQLWAVERVERFIDVHSNDPAFMKMRDGRQKRVEAALKAVDTRNANFREQIRTWAETVPIEVSIPSEWYKDALAWRRGMENPPAGPLLHWEGLNHIRHRCTNYHVLLAELQERQTVRSDLADWAAYQAYETIKERVNAAAIASGGLDGLPEEPATVARLLGGCA